MLRKLSVFFFAISLIFSICYASSIKVGASIDLTGPFGKLSHSLIKGYLLAFREANETGGINGKGIDFVYYDDRYDPKITVANLKTLVLRDKVDLLFSVFGTPETIAVGRRLGYYKKVLFAPITGFSVIYNAEQYPWIFAVLPSYKDESSQLAELISKRHKRVAVVYYPNLWGLDCFKEAVRVFRSKGVSAEKFPAFKVPDVLKAAKFVVKNKIEAVYLITPPGLTQPFISYLVSAQFYPAVYGEHYSGVTKILDRLEANGTSMNFSEVYTTMFLPLLKDSPILGKYYLSALEKYGEGEKPSYEMYYGYFLARTLVQVLRKVGDFKSSEDLKKKIENIKRLDVGLSEYIDYSPKDHKGLQKIYIYKWVGQGKLELVK